MDISKSKLSIFMSTNKTLCLKNMSFIIKDGYGYLEIVSIYVHEQSPPSQKMSFFCSKSNYFNFVQDNRKNYIYL
jgi:hypothetical protein